MSDLIAECWDEMTRGKQVTGAFGIWSLDRTSQGTRDVLESYVARGVDLDELLAYGKAMADRMKYEPDGVKLRYQEVMGAVEFIMVMQARRAAKGRA